MFVKLAPDGEAQQKLVAATDMGRKEARFYAELAAEVPVRVPACYFSAHGEERTEYVMVLEDLEAAGCRFTSREDSGADEHGGKVVEALARLHAHFWEDPRFDDELAWIPTAMRGKRGAQFVQSALEQFGDDMPPAFTDLCRLYIDHDDEIVELWDEGESTLVHGDTHAGNQFVDGDEVGFYDWAVISRSPGIRDIAMYLGNSVPTEVRQAEQDELAAGLPRRAGGRRRRRPGPRGPLGPLPPPRALRLGRGDGDRGDGEPLAADRGGDAGHDPGHPDLCRPRDGRGLPCRPLIRGAPAMTATALFVPDGPTAFTPTSAAVGPWDREVVHGAAVVALLAGQLSPPEQTLTRLSVDFLTTVPMASLTLEAGEPVGGRRVQRQEAVLSCDGRPVATARTVIVREGELDLPAEGPRPPQPLRPGGGTRTVRTEPQGGRDRRPRQLRQRQPDHRVPAGGGRSTAARLAQPGRARGGGHRRCGATSWPPSPPTTASPPCTASWASPSGRSATPNRPSTSPREPVGTWIGLRAEALVSPVGAGFNTTDLFDADGRVGRSSAALVVEHR